MSVNWGLIQTPDIGAAFQQGMETGRKNRIQRTQDNALSVLSQSPNDPASFNALMGVNPELALSLRQSQRAEQDYQRSEQTRNALLGAYDPATGRIDPAKARGAYLGAGDIEGAMKFDQEQMDRQVAQLETYQKVNEFGLQLLGGVTDQASYDAAKLQAQQLYAQNGIPFPDLPQEYNPATIQQLQMQSLDAKDQIAAKLNEMKLDEQRRHNRATEGVATQNAATARGRLGVAQGALGLARQKEGRIASGKGSIADLSGASTDELLSLLGD